METSKNLLPGSSELLFSLSAKKDFWQGRMDAVELASVYKADALKVQEALTLFKQGELARLNIDKTRSDKYREGFLIGLEDILLVIEKAMSQTKPFHPNPIYTNRSEFALSWYGVSLSGQHDAFEFALSCQGNPAAVRTQMEDAKASIKWQEAEGRHNTSPMKYQQAYLEGLSEALEIIKTFNRVC